MDTELKGLLTQVLTKLSTLQSGQDELRQDVAELRQDVTVLQKTVATMQGDITTMRGDITSLQKGQDSLRADVAVLQSGQEELRRVTSANHFRVMGRIDQLSLQLDRHLSTPHEPPTEGRKSA